MSSFMSVANVRMDNLAHVIRHQQHIMQNVYNTVSQLNQDVMILRALVISAIDNMTNYITMLNELDDIRIAMEDLAHGQLSPVLLPPQIIAYTLWSVHHALRQNFSSRTYTVLGHTTADYYRTHSFVAARQGSKLMIGLNFPLTSVPTSLTLYQIKSFAVPVPGDQNVAHVTKISNLPYGIAFSCTKFACEYLIFPHKPEPKDHLLHVGHQQSQPLRLFSIQHTCVSALLQNRRKRINHLCQFHFRPERLTPSIIPITASVILITNISSLQYTCNNTHEIAPSCVQCQMTVPCHCSVDTPFG